MTHTPRVVVGPLPYAEPSDVRPGPWTFAEDVDPRHTGLLVVSLQNDFCHPDGACGRRRQDPFLGEAVKNTRALLAVVRRAGVPVFHVRTVYNNWTVSTVVARQWRAAGTGPVCWEGSWGAEFYEILPEPEDRIVSKFRASGFLETDLELSLRAKEIETLLVAGMGAWGGAYETAWDGVARDHEVVLVEDCIAGGRAHDREVVHDLFRHYFGHVVPSEMVVGTWQGRS